MFKGGTNTSALTRPHGINVSSSTYGRTVRQIWGLALASPELVWYNDWRSGNTTSNTTLAALTGQSTSKKQNKKANPTFYSTALDLLLGHAPLLGVLSAWYNNQKLAVIRCSASGFVSGGAFSFTPVAASGLGTFTGTVPSSGPYVITVSGFVSDLNNVVVAGHALQPAAPAPGAGQYSVDASGNYTFNVAQAGGAVTIHYRKTTSGSAATLVSIFAATVAETFSQTFNDFGAPGSQTVYGTWDRPLWNAAFGVPGRIDSGAYRARDPYTWWWNGSSATANFPTALNGKPVTVYYGVPAIFKSDGTFFSATLTPLEVLNLEFEPDFASGAEYVNHPDQRIQQKWCCGLGSVRFDLGMANAMPNLNMETIGAFTQWPNGDADVADVLTDIVASGPVIVS